MPCFVALFALLTPRLVIAGLWLLSDWFVGVFDTMLWPVLGFFFAPTTLLWYSAVHHWFGGEWGTVQIIGLVFAILIDLSPASSKKRKR
jgi:hypothetical protein